MLDLALDFEQLAIYLDWKILVFPGALFVTVGILLWLAGSAKYKIFASVFIGLCGFIAGGLFDLNIVAMLVCFFGGLLLGAMLNKKAVIFSAGITAFMICVFCVYFTGLQEQPNLNRYYSGLENKLNFADSVEFIEEYAIFVFRESKDYFKELEKRNLVLSISAAVAVIVLGWFLTKTITSLVCSFWGVILISEGMAWLLLYKGTEVVTRVNNNIMMYIYIFLGMIIFGFVIQRILCPAILNKSKRTDNKNENDEKGDK